MIDKNDHDFRVFPSRLGVFNDGLTLRDYFARGAMQGMMARDSFDEGQATSQQRAKLAFIEADAMLRERDNK